MKWFKDCTTIEEVKQRYTSMKYEQKVWSDLSLANEYAFVCKANCPHCESYNVRPTGKIETDTVGGFFIEIDCNLCYERNWDGDGAFFEYFEIHREGIVPKDDV